MITKELLIHKKEKYKSDFETVEYQIKNERITNPAHTYNQIKIGLIAKLSLLDELMNY